MNLHRKKHQAAPQQRGYAAREEQRAEKRRAFPAHLAGIAGARDRAAEDLMWHLLAPNGATRQEARNSHRLSARSRRAFSVERKINRLTAVNQKSTQKRG
jgi:hypothetical protein